VSPTFSTVSVIRDRAAFATSLLLSGSNLSPYGRIRPAAQKATVRETALATGEGAQAEVSAFVPRWVIEFKHTIPRYLSQSCVSARDPRLSLM
jgi:hypothetical protein